MLALCCPFRHSLKQRYCGDGTPALRRASRAVGAGPSNCSPRGGPQGGRQAEPKEWRLPGNRVQSSATACVQQPGKQNWGAGSRPRLRLLARDKDSQAACCGASAVPCLQLGCGPEEPSSQTAHQRWESWFSDTLHPPQQSAELKAWGNHHPGGTAVGGAKGRKDWIEGDQNTGIACLEHLAHHPHLRQVERAGTCVWARN